MPVIAICPVPGIGLPEGFTRMVETAILPVPVSVRNLPVPPSTRYVKFDVRKSVTVEMFSSFIQRFPAKDRFTASPVAAVNVPIPRPLPRQAPLEEEKRVKQIFKVDLPTEVPFTVPVSVRASQLTLEQAEMAIGLFAQAPLARLSVRRPDAENFVNGAGPGVSGIATFALDPPAALACAAKLLT